jgi:ribosomal protein S18 acetylase RimI-like enzyme
VRRRPADPVADFERLYAWREAGFRALVEQGGPWIEAEQRRGLADDLAAQPYEILLDDDGAPVGNLAVRAREDHDFLDEIVVAPEHRGRGVGTQVMRELMAAARARGVPLRLSVRGGNRARSLYERLGFRVIHVAPPRTFLQWP